MLSKDTYKNECRIHVASMICQLPVDCSFRMYYFSYRLNIKSEKYARK